MRRLRSETRLRAQCGARFFLDAQKETKEAPGGERNRQAVQSTDCFSSFAPADLAMAEGLEFHWLKAPLLRRGSSPAQRDRRAGEDTCPYGVFGSTFVLS